MSYVEDESQPLMNGHTINHYDDDNRMPRLKEVVSSRRDSGDSDVEISTPPKKKMPLHFRILLMVILVCSGATMTLCMKNQDMYCLEYCNETHYNDSNEQPYEPYVPFSFNEANETHEEHHFHQPFIQLFHLGLGQILSGSFAPFFKNVDPSLKQITFKRFFPQAALASLFDVCAEVLIISGLTLTLASITEMLKTTMVVFVGLLSLYFFPGFTINWKQWVASAVMLCGSLVVILQSVITGNADGDTGSEIAGAFLVIGAQLFYGLEFVVEEKLMDHSKLEGLHVNKAILVFALGVLSMSGAFILQVPWTLITSDFPSFYHELQIYFTTPNLWASGIGISIGVMGFDLAGLGISEEMGSDRRAISVAAFQVAIVWIIATLLGWESFSWLSLFGFLLILASGAVYVYTSKSKSEPHQQRKKKLKNVDEIKPDDLRQSVDPIRDSTHQ